jgi:hypothetical protein
MMDDARKKKLISDLIDLQKGKITSVQARPDELIEF